MSFDIVLFILCLKKIWGSERILNRKKYYDFNCIVDFILRIWVMVNMFCKMMFFIIKMFVMIDIWLFCFWSLIVKVSILEDELECNWSLCLCKWEIDVFKKCLVVVMEENGLNRFWFIFWSYCDYNYIILEDKMVLNFKSSVSCFV